MPLPHYIQTGRPRENQPSSSHQIRAEFQDVEAGIQEMNQLSMDFYIADINNFIKSDYVVIPFNCILLSAAIVNWVAQEVPHSAGITFLINNVVIEFTDNDQLVVFSGNAPDTIARKNTTGANVFAIGDALEVRSNSGSLIVGPATITLNLQRT